MPTDTSFQVQLKSETSYPSGVGGFSELRSRLRRLGWPLIVGALAVQCLSAVFFVGELWSEILGLRSTALPWAWQETIQVLASLGLMLGVITTIMFLHQSRLRLENLNMQVDIAAGNFQQHLLRKLSEWQLSPSEQAVTIYTMKGFSNSEVADLRGTSLSTVKSQLNAVYRKSGLSNRQQLISFLVEELLMGVGPEED